ETLAAVSFVDPEGRDFAGPGPGPACDAAGAFPLPVVRDPRKQPPVGSSRGAGVVFVQTIVEPLLSLLRVGGGFDAVAHGLPPCFEDCRRNRKVAAVTTARASQPRGWPWVSSAASTAARRRTSPFQNAPGSSFHAAARPRRAFPKKNRLATETRSSSVVQ